ncbi:fibronectin type III domain-containing protein [Vibrio parahaemolyticus]|nr:fibronectin type III domain-containing protein [Vibrio parahaemolyticus]EGR3166358.1 fibronectin type III domain-containing protein [Vibrio parahaemolyticus]EGR3211740.1 fibronectin type III domain-containing protein [Vibrio parahaemolyticus]EJD3754271.1 fibronectin type III domain-containing protein [Vibrio parahaemolyticus]EJG0001900.1 fibronectin type III domain-containing protein [Vibrio parahaemolyticus]
MGLAAATVAWISVGLSVGATIYTMTQMPDNKSNDSIAGTKVTKNGTQSPRNRVYGTAIVGCTYVYSNVLDRDQSYRLDVFSVGGVGAVRFHNVWIDDVKMFDEDKNDLTDPANASSGIYDSSSMRPRYKKSDGFKMQWRSGQENQVAAKLAIDNSDGEWTVNHRGACVPHIVIYADYSTDQDYVFFSDRYNINALVTGAEVFDPRTGQVNGESSNTALATLDFLMNDYYGMGVTVDYINMESFKYGATFCEDNDLRINSAIDASAKFADILQDMLACCGGALAIVDGKITFLVEEKVLAPVYELNEDDILKNSLKVSPADSSSYYNVVSTTFKSEINRDNDDDFVIPQNAASDPRVMADGKIITKSLKMPYARDAYEAEDGVVQHCVKYMTNLVYNKAKFQMSCSFDIDLHKFSELRPWDVIGISSEIYGFKNKLFRVQSMKVATDADRFNIATIHCIEYDHSVYEGTVEGTGSLPRPKPDDNVPAPKNVMFTLSSFVNTGYGLLAWEASCFTPSTAYDIEYKLSSASKWTRLTSAFRGTQFTLTDLKEARYDFRVRTYELFLGSSDWTTITNINVRPAYVIPEVTGLKVETSTPNFKFTWDDMTNVEVDNIPSSDAPNSAGSTGKLADVFHQYSVQIVVNGVMKYATTTKESTFTLDLEKNKEMMGGQPSRVITFRISIEDRLGNSSLVTELVANNRQIGVAGDVDVTNANGSATVEWSPCFEPDFAGTEVHISTTKGFTPSASTLHATLGKESFYVFPFPDKTTRYMRIAHFDTMGRDGLQYSPEITLTYDGVESAKSVRLISDSQTFHVNKSGVAAPSLIIMSAFTQNVEGSVKWTTSPSVALATTSNPNERVLKYASMGNHDSVKVTVTVDGVTDTVTICKVRDGHDGQDGQDGSNGQDGNTIYEEYRYGQVINPDASWTAWGADMRTSDIYRQTRRVINDVPQAAGRVHRIAGMDGSNGADGERLFVVYHKNPVNQRPMPPEGAGNTGGWTEDSDGANWMSQKLANTIDQPLTFWSFPIQMKGNDGEVDYSHVDEIAEAKKNEAIEASIASATASVEAAEVRAKAYADGVATDAEKAAIAAADAKANAAETKAKAYADGVVTEAEQAAIAEAERLAAQAEANAKAASDPKGSASKAQQAAIAAAEEKANAAKVFAQSYADGVANDAEQAAILAAQAKADAAETKAKAYADGIVTESEQAAIEAAEAAARAAEERAKAYADGEVTKAEQAAIEAAQEAANLAETKAKAYADGVSTEAELAAIAAAEAKAKAAEVAAKAYADGEVTKAEQAAIDEAERLADEAKAHADAELKKERKRQFDPHLTEPLKTFSKVYSGSPDAISTLEGVGNISVVSGVTGGNALSLTGDHWIYSTAVIPVDPNKKYKMVVKVRQTKDKTAGGSGFYAGVATLDRNYNNLTGGAGNHRYFCAQSQTLTVAGGWRTFEGYIQGIGDNHNNFRSGTAYVRPMFIVNYSGGNGIAEVDEIRFYEVTERGDLVDLGFETTQGAQDKANAAKAAAEAYAKARAEAALNTQFVHSGFIERDGLNFRKKSGTSQWDGWASSKQTFTGGCSLTFTAGTTNAAAMCGITTPNMGGAGYNDIDFCFYIRSNGTLAIYENGKRIADYGNYTVGTVLTIRYDGIRVRYFVNGVLKREVGTSANLGFVADMSIYDVSTGFPIQGLTFIDSEGAAAWAKDSLDNRIPQANADALKTMMSNEGLRYYRKITVGGEANKYYPVIIHGGDQNKLRTIKIWRSYAETAPNSWNTATHKGALMMTWQGNFGGWGGAVYRSTLLEHSEAYSDILADCYIVNHSMGFAFFLRGGGAVYHIASDMDISGVERTNPSGGGSGIYLDGTLNSYVHATSPYNAPDALTAVNRDRLTNIKTAYNGQGQHIKNLNADNITAGKIAAQYVHADVYNGTLVNATNIKAGMLDADHINTRTFTGENAIFDAEVYGGILTGAVVRTGSTGARAEMREDGYKFAAYNAQNKPTFYVDANGNVVMNSGSISSNVLSEASRNSNIVTWIGTAGKGGNMQFTDNLVLQNDVTYFPITNNFYTTGKNGVLNVQYCAAQGYLFQDEKSAVGAAAPAQKTLPANAAPTVYFVDASNATKGSVIRMTIKYTTQFANGTAASKSNPSGTQGWRKTYAHFHIDNVATRPNVATATNVKGYKLCINLGASSIKTALKALKRAPDTISYHEDSEGGRYLPHSYKVVWSGNAAAVTNSWGEGLYYIIGTQRSDWRNCGFVMVTDENHHSPQHRSIYGQYDAYYEYRYDTKQFKASKTHIAVIIKLSGV